MVAGCGPRRTPVTGQRFSSSCPRGKVMAMSGNDAIVYIVDDDPSMCEALTRLLGTVGLRAEAFKTPQEFLKTRRPDAPSCLVLDVRLPGLSGLDLQRELASADPPIQIVF